MPRNRANYLANLIALLLKIDTKWKQPIRKRAGKLPLLIMKCGIYAVGFYSTVRKIKSRNVQLNDGLENITLSEVTQTWKDKCHFLSLMCGF